MKCTNCGKRVPDSAKVCGYCGHKLIEIEPKQKESVSTDPRRLKGKQVAPSKEPGDDPLRKKLFWPWLAGAALVLIIIVVLVLLLSTPQKAAIPAPTNTAKASISKTPVPQKTATQNPGVSLLKDVNYFTIFLQSKLVNPKVLFYEDFGDWQNHEWYTSTNVKTVNDGGTVLMVPGVEGLKAYLCSQQFYQNRGLLTKIKFSGQAYQMEFFISQNQWAAPDYMRFGGSIYFTDRLQTNIWAGTNNDLSNILMDGALRYTSDRWYGLFIGQDSSGNFLISSWALDDPGEEYTGYSIKKTGAWTSGLWNSCFQIGAGTLYVDDFIILSYDKINM